MGPVRSPRFKPSTGRLVVRWVTTSESLLSYVFDPLLLVYYEREAGLRTCSVVSFGSIRLV